MNSLCPPFEHLLPSNYLFPDMDRFFFHDFKPLYILDFMLRSLCIAVDYIGCEMQLALPNARTTWKKKLFFLQWLSRCCFMIYHSEWRWNDSTNKEKQKKKNAWLLLLFYYAHLIIFIGHSIKFPKCRKMWSWRKK